MVRHITTLLTVNDDENLQCSMALFHLNIKFAPAEKNGPFIESSDDNYGCSGVCFFG